jgi:purine nucleoside permease
MKKRFLGMVLALFCAAALVFAEGVREGGAGKPIQVKALVIAMFEVGEFGGDFAGEFQHWYERYFVDAPAYEVKGLPNPLFINKDGVAGTVAGMGKANAATTLSVILSDPRFDFSKTYILSSGCSGMPPSRGTLGDVVWAYELVDVDLGHSWAESDRPAGVTATYLRSEGYDRTGYLMLNEKLVDWAISVSKDVPLLDDPAAATYRANYGPAEAEEKPSVRSGISLTGDNYWHGVNANKHAEEVVVAYKTKTSYMVTQMEDNALGVVASRFGKLDRLLVCRDVVNYDQPYQGQTVLESLDADSGAFSIGMRNGFLVGSVVIDEIVKNWDSYADRSPGTN